VQQAGLYKFLMSMIDLNIISKPKDLGGFSVRRILPSAQRQMVGPFIFLDHLGPATFQPGEGINVRPHPHIGLATVTYLFQGELLHRDSIGSEQVITPGAINWMTAGRGIAHSERTTPKEKDKLHSAHGLQSWIALPKAYEEMPPEFHHHPADSLPEWAQAGVTLKLVAGSAYGYKAPVTIYSPMFYIEVKMQAGTHLKLPVEYRERAIYLIDGALRIGGANIAPKTMTVFMQGEAIILEAEMPTHLMLLGGEPLSEPRFIEWNFVSSSPERIAQAKADWKAGLFDKVAGDEIEFIPLPE
jgi:redox-sensitive bicupin YhaK (pirin superfamily)